MKKVVIYHNYIPKVGGIESAVYNLASGLDKEGYNVTILYRRVESPDTLFHYAEVADVVRISNGLELECDVALIGSNHEIPSELKAKRFLQWIHSDYEKYNLKLINKGRVEYISVTNHCAEVIRGREDVDSKVIYNLVADHFGEDDRPILRLVSNTRVSPEKGFGRMLKFAEKLKSEGVRFIWVIYGDNSHYPNEYEGWKKTFGHIEEVQFVGYKKDVSIGLTNTDYLVQLSDWEGCPLAVLEALKMNVPCIVTDWGGADELIKEGENGYILPMSMNIDKRHINKIVNKIPVFKYKPLGSVKEWIKIIEEQSVKI